jgi:hypothetical protein
MSYAERGRPVVVESSSLTGQAGGGVYEATVSIPNSTADARDWCIESVVCVVNDQDAAGLATADDLTLIFYGDSNYDETTVANDKAWGFVELIQESSIQHPDTAALNYYADHNVNIYYRDEEDQSTTPLAGRNVRFQLHLGSGGNFNVADDIKVRLAMRAV